MKVLVIAPHPDDESIGCGGTLCKHVARGDEVKTVFLTSGELGLKDLPREKVWRIRETEAARAAKIIGITQIEFLRLPDSYLGRHIHKAGRLLRPILKRESAAILYLPHPGEWHPDHQAALPIVRSALGTCSKCPELRGYEIWTPLSEYDLVENITIEIRRKVRAIRAHRSQIQDLRYERAISGLNQYRGEIAARARYAEVFQYL